MTETNILYKKRNYQITNLKSLKHDRKRLKRNLIQSKTLRKKQQLKHKLTRNSEYTIRAQEKIEHLNKLIKDK